MKVPQLTEDQAVIVSAYTGVLCCKFSALHAAIEEKLGRPVWTHQMGAGGVMDEVREAFKPDFLAICARGPNLENKDE